MPNLIPSSEYIGKKFFLLTITEDLGRLPVSKSQKSRKVKAICECGTEVVNILNNIKRGLVKSCGCYKRMTTSKRSKTHGLSESRIYRIHRHMMNRCNDIMNPNYGGRGITFCKEWESFENFYDWAMSNGYADNLEIDRYPDINGNYEPSNCRWATDMEQHRNRRSTVMVYFHGELLPLADLAIKYNMNYGTLKTRIYRSKWSVEKAIETPLMFPGHIKSPKIP